MRLKDELIVGNAIEILERPMPLLEGVLDYDSTAVLYGPSGAAKSFTALDWGMCVAYGVAWHRHALPHGQDKVLYVVGEGLSGTSARYSAWKAAHKADDVPLMVFAPHAVNVTTDDGRAQLLEAVADTEPGLVILDTVARHIAGGDENSFQTMSLLTETMDEAKRMQGACILAVHHTGKDVSAGGRGHSSFKGAVDTEIFCTKGPTLAATKQKDHPDGHIIGSFDLVPMLDSMVLAPRKGKPQGVNDDLAMAVFNGHALSFTEWRDAAVLVGVPSGSFNHVRKSLLAAGKVIQTADPISDEARYNPSI